MQSIIRPYIANPQDWKSFIKDKWLLFDANAIISILAYNAEKIFDDFSKLGVENCYIHPIYAELLRTDNIAERTLRSTVFSTYKFNLLPLTEKTLKISLNIQTLLAAKNCFPSPIDIYLGGILASYTHNKIVLLSGDLKDLPYPLFKRESYVVLQNNKHSKLLSFLTIDHIELAKI